MVTHDQGEALTIADNVLLMDKGKIVQKGTPLDLYRFPETVFSADFIGTNNFLRGTLQEAGQNCTALLEGSTAALERGALPGRHGAGRAGVGVRPRRRHRRHRRGHAGEVRERGVGQG